MVGGVVAGEAQSSLLICSSESANQIPALRQVGRVETLNTTGSHDETREGREVNLDDLAATLNLCQVHAVVSASDTDLWRNSTRNVT